MDSSTSERVPSAALNQSRVTAAHSRAHAPGPFVWEVREHYPPLPLPDGHPYLPANNSENADDRALSHFLIRIDLMLYAAGCGLCICFGAIMLS